MMSSISEGPRNFITTPDDHGGIALTVSTLLMTWMILCCLIRIYLRADVNGPFGLDDLTVCVATVVGVAQSITQFVGISNGFGKSLKLLDGSQITTIQKAEYASDILYVAANCLAKCSVALLLERLARARRHVWGCRVIVCTSAIWGFASIVAIGIRCELSRPWDKLHHQCTNLFLRWQLITALEVIIEVALLFMALWLVWSLQMARRLKAIVFAAFAFRAPVIMAALVRLYYLGQDIASANPFFDGVPAQICTQVAMNYSLMAATVPCLKPFIISFNTSWGTTTIRADSAYAMHSMSDKPRSRSTAPGSGRPTDQPSFRPDLCSHTTRIGYDPKPPPRGDSGSVESHGSEQRIIRRTEDWSVRYEDQSLA